MAMTFCFYIERLLTPPHHQREEEGALLSFPDFLFCLIAWCLVVSAADPLVLPLPPYKQTKQWHALLATMCQK